LDTPLTLAIAELLHPPVNQGGEDDAAQGRPAVLTRQEMVGKGAEFESAASSSQVCHHFYKASACCDDQLIKSQVLLKAGTPPQVVVVKLRDRHD
jgi:hypothetical protein